MEVGFIVTDTLEEIVGEELLSEEIDKIVMCQAFDLLMEYGPADTKLPWWYCELGSL